MTTLINASPTNGLVQTADGSGVLKVQSNGVTTNALAWVNFNGTGAVAIRSSYNVSSITDNGTGDYTVNFTNAMSDANYAYACSGSIADGVNNSTGLLISGNRVTSPATSSLKISTTYNGSGADTRIDAGIICVAIFGN